MTSHCHDCVDGHQNDETSTYNLTQRETVEKDFLQSADILLEMFGTVTYEDADSDVEPSYKTMPWGMKFLRMFNYKVWKSLIADYLPSKRAIGTLKTDELKNVLRS